MAHFKQPFRAPPLRKKPANVLQFRKSRTQRADISGLNWLRKNWAIALPVASPFVGIAAAWAWQSDGARFKGLTQGAGAESEEFYLTFSRCSGPIRVNCVVDGDTIWLKGQKIRIADINTPEVSEPQCSVEATLGARAADRLRALLNAGGFSLHKVDRDEDGYGRKLRVITRGGESLGAILVSEGLAEKWTGSRSGWC